MAHSQPLTIGRRTGLRRLNLSALPALLYGQFAFFGLILGIQGVVWDDVMRHLALTPSLFGTLALITPLIGLTVLLNGATLARFSDRQRAVASLLAVAAALFILARADNLAAFVLSRSLAGLGYGLLEGAATGAALAWERTSGKRLLSLLYAVLSAAMVLGALAAGGLLQLGWAHGAILLPAGLSGLALAGLSLLVLYPARVAPAARAVSAARWRSDRLIRSLIWLCLVASGAEAIAGAWSVIHLRALGADPLLAGVAFALFNAAMVLGRLLNNLLVARIGPRNALRSAGVAMAIAAILIGAADIVATIAGFTLLGLALAGVVPLALSLAGEAAPDEADGAHHAILAATFASVIVAPPLVGWLTNLLPLHTALLLGLLLMALPLIRCGTLIRRS